MSNKALATVQILDALGNPIPKIHYQVKNQKTDQHVVKGITNSKGCFYEIQRDKGTVLDVYVKNLFDDGMKKVKSFTLSKDRMLVKVISPKLLIDLKTLENNGKQGGYKRKTHIVQKGDTLTSIAQKYQTTVRALDVLNKLENKNKISIGQIIKLPVNTPATGNKSSQDKKPQPIKKQPTNNKPQKSTPPKQDAKKADESSVLNIDDYKNKALEKLNEWYEDGKKALTEVIKIEMKEDRSQDGGTPKSDTSNLCKSSPQCISSGQSELIREINIRLAGFGGALPTDQFTPLTEACIKQFQRDYMGVPETGKICGSVLVALDKFYNEYPIAGFMKDASCPCGKCKGFGNNKRGISSGLNTANEYPGLHRSLIWILKALNFYLKNEFKVNKLEVAYISSGYRCIENNIQKKRTSVNHMGMALDIHFNKAGKRTKDVNDMELIRKKILIEKMNASEQRVDNKIYLEPKKFNDGKDGAITWVHFDITKFPSSYFDDLYFKKTVENLNGKLFTVLVTTKNQENLLNCGGFISQKKPENKEDFTDVLILSDQDILDIMKVTETEVIKFKNEKNFSEQAAGVVDTILNRTKSGVWGDSIRSVVNAHRQFSKITGPKSLKPYGSVQNMPISAVSSRIRNFVNKYMIERANGKPSIVGGHLNYANKYYSDEYNKKKWVNAFHDKAVKDGLIFGNGTAIHAHGTVPELQESIPKPFKVELPKNFQGV
ncbi:LysM peptidoglycan-binding domain-containing protein [Acinetobacter cumulans]|uniref:LysM peptidoglycan-binding domain-containing protein n=1 Tax=Acinetobacter cumulans TaxID=2136182 RepID=A0A3A8FYZ8_9GAMM|nr:LysM peptidoglycan-binding domain-containing protein [Acinetobacter cumulans]RKG52117.1 LysM peptidoglycan-binding domain-containing protein [Acinetobacter cumulans]